VLVISVLPQPESNAVKHGRLTEKSGFKKKPHCVRGIGQSSVSRSNLFNDHCAVTITKDAESGVTDATSASFNAKDAGFFK